MSFARAKYSDYEFSHGSGLMALSTHKPMKSTQNVKYKYKREFKVTPATTHTHIRHTPHHHVPRHSHSHSLRHVPPTGRAAPEGTHTTARTHFFLRHATARGNAESEIKTQQIKESTKRKREPKRAPRVSIYLKYACTHAADSGTAARSGMHTVRLKTTTVER
jgi:hypothetical protein